MRTEPSNTLVLVVEDNPADVLFLRYAFEEEPAWRTEMIVATDGEEAVKYLLSPERAKPDLVILDLNLPKRSGVEVLGEIRRAPATRRLPVIVFSSSPEDVLKDQLAQTGVAPDGYITKPFDFAVYSTLARRFRHYYEAALRPETMFDPQ